MEGKHVAAIAAGAVAVRLGVIAASYPEFSDLDSYRTFAAGVAAATGGRSFLAALADEGALRAPLYPLFLSAVARVTPSAVAALVVQALLSAVTVAAVFRTGLSVSSRRAALLAAVLVAVWPPSVEAASALWSEHLYVPFVALGFAFIARRTSSPSMLVLAGAAFGVAALTRAMPLFFLPLALLIVPRLRLALGFAVMVAPYVLFASLTAGRFVPIETEGTLGLYRTNPPGQEFMRPGSEAPGLAEAMRITAAQFEASPVHFTRAQLGRVRGLFVPGWWARGETARRLGASEPWLRGLPLLVVVPVLVMAPFGWRASADRVLTRLLVAWIALHVVLVPLSGNTGPRYRAAMDPALILLASAGIISFSGGSRRPAL